MSYQLLHDLFLHIACSDACNLNPYFETERPGAKLSSFKI